MKRIEYLHGLGLILAVFAGMLSMVEAQESVSVLLQKGLFAEETEGDLEAAIAIYNDIVQQTDQSRAVAAQALYRLSLCHLKLGDKEKAQASLNKLVEEYTDQESLVALAKKELEAPAEKPESEVVARRIWKDAIDPTGRVSSDGRYYAHIDWTTGNLAVRDLQTGQDRNLTKKGDWSQSEAFAMYPVFSPDDRQIAYVWTTSSDETLFELRVISVEGKETPEVKARFKGWLQLYDWSSERAHLAALVWDEQQKAYELACVSSEDGSVKRLRSLKERTVSNARFSPDGGYLAYDVASDPRRPEQDVFVMRLDTGGHTFHLRHPSDERVMEWTGQGRGLLVRSDRAGTKDLWLYPLENGLSVRQGRLVKGSVGGIIPLGWTGDSRLFYGILSGGVPLYEASLDFDTGRLIRAPRELRLEPLRAALSPDGRRVAAWIKENERSRPKLVILDRSKDEVSDLWLPENDQKFDQPVWSKDGRYLFQRVDEEDSERAELLLIEVETGRRTSLGPDKAGGRHDLAVAFSQEALVYNRRDPVSEELVFVRRELKDGMETRFTVIDGADAEKSVQVAIRSDLRGVFYSVEPEDASEKSVVFAHDFESGEKRKIAGSERRVRLYSGPKPSLLAITDYSFSQPYDVRVVDVAAERPVEKWRASLPNFSSIVCKGWSPDGRHLMFSVVQENLLEKTKDWPTHLWTVATEDGSVQKTSFSWRVVSQLGVAPDGKEVVYQSWREQISEVWHLDHLLAESSD